MSSVFNTKSRVISRWLSQASILLCLLMLSTSAFSQALNTPLWSYVESHDHWPKVPSHSIAPQAIQIQDSVFSDLEAGDLLHAPSADGLIQDAQAIVITQAQTLINGDVSYRGELLDGRDSGPFVLTVNPFSVFAYIEIGAQVWQLEASRSGVQSPYIGWLYQATALNQPNLARDFLIPSRSLNAPQMPAFEPTAMPLSLGNSGTQSTLAQARNSGITEANFTISQTPNSTSVVAGGRVEIGVELRNTSLERHQALTLNLYFILENSTLISAPGSCKQGLLGGQKVLQCALGDFAPGESKTSFFTVQSSSASKPRLVSTALVGDVRHDAVINIIEDVVLDSDGDGLSDFNEKLLGTNPSDSASKDSNNSVIDVMALYTAGANSLYGGQAQTRINHLIAIANQIYADSGVQITLRPVYHGLVAYSDATDMEAGLKALTSKSASAFAQVDGLRNTYGADVVMLFRPQGKELDRCGLANLGGFGTQGDMVSSDEKQYAYSTVAIDCPVSSVVAHELGHNMGLTHSHLEDGFGGTFDFATGYGVQGRFSTVMAYPGAFNTTVRLPRFSNPLLECLGVPCGIASQGTTQGADAVRALNVTRHQIAQYFPTRVPYLPNRPLATLSGQPTNAKIALAASVDKGLSYVSSVNPQDKIDINLSLLVDSRHVGLDGDIFVVATLDGEHYFQLDSEGAISDWDGEFTGLSPYRLGGTLAPVEYLQIISAISLGEEFVNRRLQIFIAYSVPSKGELVYTSRPLSVDITP
ncbi:MAG: reprolysin-like metallopeptidase [Gammaproteobacteria bacterium]